MAIAAQLYGENRSFLWGLCYRMTGSAADAEEVVQETFVRALERPPRDTRRPLRPWLVRVAMNLSRDLMRRRRRAEYVGPWLPSPIPPDDSEGHVARVPKAADADSPAARYDMRESVSVAFLLALEALTPAQRAVLLLRDVFDYSTAEAGEATGMTEANVKVTLHRARRRLREYDKERTPPDHALQERTQKVLEEFLRCLEARDAGGLERLLTEDVVVVSDGGGEVTALLEPMRGREKVLRLVTRLYENNRSVMRISFCVLNAQPAVLVERSGVRPGHAARYTMQCEFDEEGRIRRLNFVFAPSKLSALDGRG
jgi:RNA polymerase sigma-70 factor (ECF subfamily)